MFYKRARQLIKLQRLAFKLARGGVRAHINSASSLYKLGAFMEASPAGPIITEWRSGAVALSGIRSRSLREGSHLCQQQLLKMA